MTGFVKIKSGTYRNAKVENEVFPLVKHYTVGAKGGFLTVDGTGQFGKDKVRVLVDNVTDFEFVHADEYTGVVNKTERAVASTTTDEQRIVEIAERFEILDDMTKATLNGDIRAMIVSGPPGVGKSFTVERELERSALFDQISGRRVKSTIVKGSATAIGLYKTLYEFSDSNCVIVFDDCDSILFDDVCLNLLKGALDSGKNRKISWLSESRVLKNEGIPNSFTFHGSVIFITNLKFDQVRSQKMKDHLEALQSRCHYLDLTLDTMRDKILRIKQIADTGVLFADYDFEQCAQDEIIDFLNVNKNKMREMSLRMAIKVAELRKSFPLKWQALASTTCMKAN
jgi:hypothetical protein